MADPPGRAAGPGPRTLFHVDMDAFFAAVEQRDRPELRGRPVVVGGASARGVVAAASYEARVFGIHSAMPSAEARKRCPGAIFVAGDMAKYRRESRRIFEIFRRYSPLVEGLSLDEAFLDMTGTERLLGPPAVVAERLRAEVRAMIGLAASVGVAPVKMVAKIASDQAKPDGLLVVAPAAVRDFLAPLPVGRIWGVGGVGRARLAALGVATIGDLAALPAPALRAALGPWGEALARLARGDDTREVKPWREAKSYGEESTFERDVRDRDRLETVIRAHAESVARRLRRDGVRARCVVLKLKLGRPLGGGRYPLLTRARTLAVATDDGAVIAATARALLAEAWRRRDAGGAAVGRVQFGPDDTVRLLGVAVQHLEADGGGAQLALGLDGGERRRRLNAAIDAIQDRFGAAAVQRGGADVRRAGLTTQIKRGED